MRRILFAALLAGAAVAPAHAQVILQEQVTVAVNPAAIQPPDPQAWWTDRWPAKPEAMNPLRRRLGRGERPPGMNIDNGVPPLLYRLWMLTPLQEQLVRRGEAVVEMWARPAETVRQAVVRVTLRSDGRAFVQGRAGFGCCEPEIYRLVMFDQELPADRAAAVQAIVQDPLWGQPRFAEIVEDGTTLDLLCVNGVSYDVSLVVPGGGRSLHRACSGEQVGSIQPVLTALLTAAMGYEPRFDVVFPRGPGFEQARSDYQSLLSRGGQLQTAPNTPEQATLIPEPLPEAPDPAVPIQ